MGCIAFWIEFIFDSIIEGWFSLMQWIVPDKLFGKTFRIILKIFIGLFCCVLFMSMLLGLLALISDDAETRYWGKYMLVVPIIISMIQIGLGIIVRNIGNKK